MQAYSQSRGEILEVSGFDIVGGFLRIKRDPSFVRLFLFLPSNMPHPLAGCYLEVHAALYGLKESSRLFSLAVTECLVTHGFVQCSSSPCSYVLRESGDSGKMCQVSTHVDDFRSLTNSAPHLSAHLRRTLVDRFEEVTDVASGVFVGVEHNVLSNGAVQITQNSYIRRVAERVGVAHLPPVPSPAGRDFFDVSVSPDDVVPCDVSVYQSLTGSLVQMLQCRDEVKPLVSHLCSANHRPTMGDYNKALAVLSYLFSTPSVGRTYMHDDPRDTCMFSDAAFATLPDGHSTEANFLSIGPHSAPFSSYAKAQSEVAPDPMSAEYYSASLAVRQYAHFAQFAAELGFASSSPAVLFLDCQTAINLAVAPEVTKKARHMAAKHHYIREAKQQDLIDIVHVTSPFMRCDTLTKLFSTPAFQRGRSDLLNLMACPSPG